MGAWSGLTRDEIAVQYADEFIAWQQGSNDVRPGGGENAAEVIGRVRSFVESVREEYSAGPIVAVTHSGWIRSAITWAFGEQMARSSLGIPAQGSLTVFLLKDNGSIVLEAFNDRGHLLDVEPIDREPPAAPVY